MRWSCLNTNLHQYHVFESRKWRRRRRRPNVRTPNKRQQSKLSDTHPGHQVDSRFVYRCNHRMVVLCLRRSAMLPYDDIYFFIAIINTFFIFLTLHSFCKNGHRASSVPVLLSHRLYYVQLGVSPNGLHSSRHSSQSGKYRVFVLCDIRSIVVRRVCMMSHIYNDVFDKRFLYDFQFSLISLVDS